MNDINLTRRQRDVLVFVHAYREQHGIAPSLREIGAELGGRNVSTVLEHVRQLEQKGCLIRGERTGLARDMTLTPAGVQIALAGKNPAERWWLSLSKTERQAIYEGATR